MKEAVIDISRLSRLRAPRVSGPTVRRIAVIVAVIALLWGTLYQVGPDEVGVVQRFGRYVRATQSGLRLQWPLIETVTKVPVQRQLRQEFGFRTTGDPQKPQKVAEESTMLTGDLNVAVVEWIVQYRIADPDKYLFRVRDGGQIFRDLAQAVMEAAVGDRTLTEVVTIGRQDVESAVQAELQGAVDRYDMGLRVQQVVLQDVNPPDPVKPSWDAVNQAQQERDRLINEARAQYNTVVPRARGEAEQAILAADGYAVDRVNRAEGEASRFAQLQEAYVKAPDVTRRRLQLETMARVLPRVGGKVVVDKDTKSVLPLLPLDSLRGAVASSRSNPGSEAMTPQSTTRLLATLMIGLAIVYVVQDGIHFNDEAAQVVITQFGDPVGTPVAAPGLFFDLPLVQTENRFDRRTLEYTSKATQVPTKDKRYISVSAFALWRINDALKMFQRVQDETGAQARLDEIITGEVRNAVARYDLIELVRTSTRDATNIAVQSGEESVILTKLEQGRARLAAEVLTRVRSRSADLGFEILDLRFKHMSYVDEVQKAVFARMIAERQRVAEQYRSEGQGEAARIGGERDRDLAQISSEAYRSGEERRGKADGAAARIYAGAYGKDPDFYAFVKSLETYEKSLDPNTIMILDGGSDLLKYLGRSK